MSPKNVKPGTTSLILHSSAMSQWQIILVSVISLTCLETRTFTLYICMFKDRLSELWPVLSHRLHHTHCWCELDSELAYACLSACFLAFKGFCSEMYENHHFKNEVTNDKQNAQVQWFTGVVFVNDFCYDVICSLSHN